MYLGGEAVIVDRVFRSSAVRRTEVQDDLADTVLVGQWSAADVHIVKARLVEDQADVVSRVFQHAAHLQTTDKVNNRPSRRVDRAAHIARATRKGIHRPPSRYPDSQMRMCKAYRSSAMRQNAVIRIRIRLQRYVRVPL